MEEFIRIIKAKDVQDGDLLLIDHRAGIDPEAFTTLPDDFPRINILFVKDAQGVRHIPVGQPIMISPTVELTEEPEQPAAMRADGGRDPISG